MNEIDKILDKKQYLISQIKSCEKEIENIKCLLDNETEDKNYLFEDLENAHEKYADLLSEYFAIDNVLTNKLKTR